MLKIFLVAVCLTILAYRGTSIQEIDRYNQETSKLSEQADGYFNLAIEQREYERQQARERAEAERQGKVDRVWNALEGMPYQKYSDVFVDVAIKYNLDFRLLPSIVIAESSGGKNCGNGRFNCFGYSRGGYASVGTPPDDIDYIGSVLASDKHYAGKDPVKALITWNGDSDYTGILVFNSI